MSKLFRVYTLTEGDHSVSERFVSADTEASARHQALLNVKAQNTGKGLKASGESKAQTRILSCSEAGVNGVVTTHRIPVRAWVEARASMSVSQVLADLQNDVLNLAGLPSGSSSEEALQILEVMTTGSNPDGEEK